MADYTDLAKVKAFVGKVSDTAIDGKINNAIPWVTAYINRNTGRRFDPFTVTGLKVNATDRLQSKLILYDHENSVHLLPIRTITSLVEGGATLVEDTDFFVNKGSGVLEKNTSTTWLSTGQAFWSTIIRDITVSGDFGPATVFPDIEAIATELVAIIVLEKTKTYDTAEGIQTAVITKFPDYVKETLLAYRVVST